MASSAAQDEFDTMVANSAASHSSSHPADRDGAQSSDDGSTTIAPSSAGPSVRSSIAHSINGAHNKGSRGRPMSFLNDSSDSDGENENTAIRGAGAPSKYYLPSTYQKGAMTGPKGVIADAKAFEREKRGKKSSDFKRTMDLALPRSQSYGGRSPGGHRRDRSGSADIDEEDEDQSGSELDDSDDAETLRKWREKRADELKTGIGKTRERHFGLLENVTGFQFLEAVEKAGRGAVVVVYIFDDEQPVSDAYVPHLAALAEKHSTVHFIALHYLDAEIDSAGVPAILAYRNGDKFADILPLAPEVSSSGSNVESALEKVMIGRNMLR